MSRGQADPLQQPQPQGTGTTGQQDEEESEAEPPDLSLRPPSQEPAHSLGTFLGLSHLRGTDVGVYPRTGGVGGGSSSSSSREPGLDLAFEAQERIQEASSQQAVTNTREQRRQRRQSRRPASCTNCRARKVRCDKVIPCSQCFLRGISHTCAAPASTGLSQDQAPESSNFGRREPSEQEGEGVLRRMSAPTPTTLASSAGSAFGRANPFRHHGPTMSQTGIEQRLAALERKVDRLISAVERLSGSATVLSPGQDSLLSETMPFGAPHRTTRSEQLDAQARQQQHYAREEQTRREQAAALSSLFQSLSRTALPTSLSTTASTNPHSSTDVVARGSQESLSYFPPLTEQQGQPADFSLLAHFDDSRINIAEPESDATSFFSRTPDGSYTSILASLSLGEGEDTRQEPTPSTSSPD